jgi:hypothetical protein
LPSSVTVAHQLSLPEPGIRERNSAVDGYLGGHKIPEIILGTRISAGRAAPFLPSAEDRGKGAIMTTQPTPRASLHGNHVAVQLQWYLRTLSALGAMSALVYAALLGWRTNANGVVTAAAFAVGFLFATFALAGVVPANIKIGDVEVKLQQARETAPTKAESKDSPLVPPSAKASQPVTWELIRSRQPCTLP